ncbi:MAG TPA: MoxR family ATPase [Actinomycetota bacterium]|nr:MoxR family ATPase [Actinomycetota bacterium]
MNGRPGAATDPEAALRFFAALAERIEGRLFGVEEALRLILIGVLSDAHVLIDDVPGVGKTTMVRMLAGLLGLEFQRVQFTPDLMPSDITGTSILNLKSQEFEFRRGPIFTQILLADEINRATPKTQAALLEAMQERQITVDGVTYPLPDPFFVLATQNPVELEGTFPLPEAQLDRFLLKVQIGYPDEAGEERILTVPREDRTFTSAPLAESPDLGGFRGLIGSVRIDPSVRQYVVALARATRDHPDVQVGASPRSVEHMGDAVRAKALLDGRVYALPDDVKELAGPVLTHRLVLSVDARIRDRRAEDVIEDVLESVPVPVEFSPAGG